MCVLSCLDQNFINNLDIIFLLNHLRLVFFQQYYNHLQVKLNPIKTNLL